MRRCSGQPQVLRISGGPFPHAPCPLRRGQRTSRREGRERRIARADLEHNRQHVRARGLKLIPRRGPKHVRGHIPQPRRGMSIVQRTSQTNLRPMSGARIPQHDLRTGLRRTRRIPQHDLRIVMRPGLHRSHIRRPGRQRGRRRTQRQDRSPIRRVVLRRGRSLIRNPDLRRGRSLIHRPDLNPSHRLIRRRGPRQSMKRSRSPTLLTRQSRNMRRSRKSEVSSAWDFETRGPVFRLPCLLSNRKR